MNFLQWEKAKNSTQNNSDKGYNIRTISLIRTIVKAKIKKSH